MSIRCFYKPDFHKLSLTKHSAELLKTSEKIKSSAKCLKSSVACLYYNTAHAVPVSHCTLHYPFHWIRFLEINKLCNVIAENLTFSTNRKLISISWKVWACSNFSTNWKWKWINRIQHGRKNVAGKQKFKLIWKIIYQISSHVIKIILFLVPFGDFCELMMIWLSFD